MGERRIRVRRRTIAVKQTGDPQGQPVVYFHGTPGSRLEPDFGAGPAAAGVRVVCFDRPGYGASSPTPFGLSSVAEDTALVADELGIPQFATLGQSGGGPFALAAAAILGDRVTRVGVASGRAMLRTLTDQQAIAPWEAGAERRGATAPR